MNAAFRRTVTQTAFNLALTENQVACLVWLSTEHRDEHGLELRIAFSSMDIGLRSLERRGLVVQCHPSDHWGKKGLYDDRWKLTNAGAAVVTLLKEAGLHEDIAASQGHHNALRLKTAGAS